MHVNSYKKKRIPATSVVITDYNTASSYTFKSEDWYLDESAILNRYSQYLEAYLWPLD